MGMQLEGFLLVIMFVVAGALSVLGSPGNGVWSLPFLFSSGIVLCLIHPLADTHFVLISVEF